MLARTAKAQDGCVPDRTGMNFWHRLWCKVATSTIEKARLGQILEYADSVFALYNVGAAT